jgi:hypothetical protein
MSETIIETIGLQSAKEIIKSLAATQSVLLLSAPGVGKSETVEQAALECGLECKSLLGTQIAPEDVSGIPRIVGERSVFCPPRVLLPETPEPFCLFLDELPATAPDVQKAFYSLLLERRIGEYKLPEGTWVVAAGNRMEDRALVRAMSSALVNRVVILNIKASKKEWFVWAKNNNVRSEIISFVNLVPDALMRPVPAEPVPFSTPRSWTLLSRALDAAEASGILSNEVRRALSFGRVSAEDAAVFCTMSENNFNNILPPLEYILNPDKMPTQLSEKWFVLSMIRNVVKNNMLVNVPSEKLNKFLQRINQESRFALLVDLVPDWARLGAGEAMFDSLKEITGL